MSETSSVMMRINTNSTPAVAMSAVQIGRVAEFDDDIRRHRAHAVEYARREHRLIARDHDDRHRFPDDAPQPQNDGSHDARFCRGHFGAEDRAFLGRAQRERALVITFRHGADSVFRHADDGG